jgi:hypothetical protein
MNQSVLETKGEVGLNNLRMAEADVYMAPDQMEAEAKLGLPSQSVASITIEFA